MQVPVAAAAEVAMAASSFALAAASRSAAALPPFFEI
jgi:hypothetical protein